MWAGCPAGPASRCGTSSRAATSFAHAESTSSSRRTRSAGSLNGCGAGPTSTRGCWESPSAPWSRPGESPTGAADRVKAAAVEFCERDLTGLWPTGGPSFDWDAVADPDRRPGRERFQSQYWRANVAGSERYVLTPAGDVEHRLPSD